MVASEPRPASPGGPAPPTGPRVLVVDDEPTVGAVLSRYLEREGFRPTVRGDGRSALEAAAAEPPDLVVLDVMLPDLDGLEVLERLRGGEDGHPDARSGPAVILLTARGGEDDRIDGLRRGADDYVVKPFSPGELVARVEAVLRRRGAGPAAAGSEAGGGVIEHAGLRIDPEDRSVRVDGREVLLTQRELELLLHLARHPGRVFSREELMDAVWEFAFYTDTSTVTVHVRRLRTKIEADPAEPRFVQTVWGRGYRFRP